MIVVTPALVARLLREDHVIDIRVGYKLGGKLTMTVVSRYPTPPHTIHPPHQIIPILEESVIVFRRLRIPSTT